jgi:hypothetical protein
LIASTPHLLTLLGRRRPAALVIIAVYTAGTSSWRWPGGSGSSPGPVLRYRGNRNGILYLLIGIAAWVAFLKSGVDPIVVGLVFGLLTYAYSATRESLEQASEAFRLFREQPTAELAQSARTVVRTAISPNDRLAALPSLDQLVIVPCSRWPTRASCRIPSSWPWLIPRRSRPASSSGTWWASRSARRVRVADQQVSHGRCGRRWLGRGGVPVRSPGSASPCPR